MVDRGLLGIVCIRGYTRICMFLHMHQCSIHYTWPLHASEETTNLYCFPILYFFFLFLWVMQIVKWWFCAEWLHAYLHECLPTCDCSPNTQVSSRDWSGKECMNEYELSKYIDFNFGLVNLVFRHANGRLSAGIQMRNRGYIGNSAYIRGRHMAKWVRL